MNFPSNESYKMKIGNVMSRIVDTDFIDLVGRCDPKLSFFQRMKSQKLFGGIRSAIFLNISVKMRQSLKSNENR